MKTFNERFRDRIDMTDGTVVLDEKEYNKIQEDVTVCENEILRLSGMLRVSNKERNEAQQALGLTKEELRICERRGMELMGIINRERAKIVNFNNGIKRIERAIQGNPDKGDHYPFVGGFNYMVYLYRMVNG